MARWLVKTEPRQYSFTDLMADTTVAWEGVRGHQARAHMRRMSPGDQVLVYHSGSKPQVVGTAVVVRGPYDDPLDRTGVLIDIGAGRPLPGPVTLSAIKERGFQDWALVRQPRLSVLPVPDEAWDWIMNQAGR